MSSARRRLLALGLGLILGAAVVLAVVAFRPQGTAPTPAYDVASPPERRPPGLEGRFLASTGRDRASPAAPDTIRILVTDPAGSPLPEARAYLADSGRLSQRSESTTKLEAGEEGLYRIDLAGNDARDLLVTCVGYVPFAERVETLVELGTEGTEPVLITLQRGATVSGTVRSDTGEPIAGAEVCVLGRFGRDLLLAEERLPTAISAADLQRTVTDERGSFTISGILSFPVRAMAFKTHFIHLERTDPIIVESADQPVEIVMYSFRRFGVAAIDRRTREPIRTAVTQVVLPAGTWFSTYGGGPRPDGVPRTGWSHDVPSVRWWTVRATPTNAWEPGVSHAVVDVEAPGYSSVKGRAVEIRAPADPRFNEAQTVELDAEMRPSEFGAIAVRVSCAVLGRPLPWAYIDVTRLDPVAATTRRSFRVPVSLKRGKRASMRLPRGQYRLRVAKGTGWFWWEPDGIEEIVEVEPDRPVEVEFAMKAAKIRFHVTDDHGRVLEDYVTTGYRDPPEERPDTHRRLMGAVHRESLLHDEIYEPYRSALPVTSGQVVILVTPGAYGFAVERAGYARSFQDVKVASGETMDVRIRLAKDR